MEDLSVFGSMLDIPGGVRVISVMCPTSESEFIVGLFGLGFPILLNVNEPYSSADPIHRHPASVVLMCEAERSLAEVLNTTVRYQNTVYVSFTSDNTTVGTRLQEFWDHFIISAFVILATNTTTEVYGFEPTPNGVQVQRKTSISKIGLFDMHGSRMNVSVVNLSPSVILNPNDDTTIDGLEGRIMLEIAKTFNCKPYFALPQDGEWWGWVVPKPAGVLGEIDSGYSGFGFGMLAMTAVRLATLDQIAGFEPMECLTWAVPKGAGPAAAPWVAMLLTEFSTDTWIAIAVTSVFVIGASLLVDGTPFGATLFRIFASSIGSSITLPVIASSRILMLTWLWSSFILVICYQSSMGSKLAVPPENPDINTFADLLASSLEVLGLYNSIKFMRSEDPVIKAVTARSIPTTITIRQAFDRIVAKRDIAYMRQRSTFRFQAIEEPESFGDIHLMEDCGISYYPSITLKKWSPYHLGAQKVIHHLFEGGLTAKWEKDLMPTIPPSPVPPTPLGVNQLLGAFAILLAGLGISTLVFISEKIKTVKFKCRSKRKIAWQK